MRLHVGVFAAITNLTLFSDILRHDAQVDADLDGLAILIGRQEERVVALEVKSHVLGHLLLQEGRVVRLVQVHLLLSQTHVLKHLFQVKCPFTDVVIRLE